MPSENGNNWVGVGMAEFFYKRRFLWLWSTLAFQAGFTNSIGFLTCGRFVSHVTGFSTGLGQEAANGNLFLALLALSAPTAFIIGAWVSGLFTAVPMSRGSDPKYGWAMGLMSALFFLVFVLGVRGFFGPFDKIEMSIREFMFLWVLSFICGLQNACFSHLTKGQVRTTHLTGLSTDFGQDSALLQFGKLKAEEREILLKKNLMRAATFICFSAGGFISVLIDHVLQFWCLAIPLGTSILLNCAYVIRVDGAFFQMPQMKPHPA